MDEGLRVDPLVWKFSSRSNALHILMVYSIFGQRENGQQERGYGGETRQRYRACDRRALLPNSLRSPARCLRGLPRGDPAGGNHREEEAGLEVGQRDQGAERRWSPVRVGNLGVALRSGRP